MEQGKVSLGDLLHVKLDHQFSGEFRKLCPFLRDYPVAFGNGAELTFRVGSIAALEVL